MKETSKSHELRVQGGHYDRYLKGAGIDIGAGDDTLTIPDGSVISWDWAQGDAHHLASVPSGELDFVFSSHCLEHLADLPLALGNWSRVLKPGAFAYIVIPDYTLYEHHNWPSRFNGDHKQSFSLTLESSKVGRANHWCIHEPKFADLLRGAGFKIVECEIQDKGYDYNLGHHDQTLTGALAQILLVLQKDSVGA